MSSDVKKPVKLQANTAGAWKDVARFDAANDLGAAHVMDAAETIGRVTSGATTFRVVIDDAMATPLFNWSLANGWKETRHAV